MNAVTGYPTAAPIYRCAGWLGVLPLPPAKKDPPPTGWTGRNAPYPDDETVQRWRRSRPASAGIALRLPPTVLGIDVDCWGGKPGAESFAKLVDRHGELPPTWASTSREDGSRIRFFRVPPGVRWEERRAGPGIELLRAGHRYAIVWPSLHPEGRQYRWLTPGGAVADRIPTVDELPLLPAAWGRGLTAPPVPPQRRMPARTGQATNGCSTYASVTLAATIEDLSRLRAGDGRNRALNIAAYKLGGFIGAGELARDLVEEELLAAANANGYVSKRGAQQAEATINSGLNAGIARPRAGAQR